MEKRILIVVGSTGGHYFPGIALAEKIKEMSPNTQIIFAGERKIKDLEIWKKQELNFISIPVLKKPERKFFLLPITVLQGIFVLFKNLSLMNRFCPDLVVCMGSYASVIIGISALLFRKPIIAHEQNLIPGLANKLLNFLGVPVAITFKETEKFLKKTFHTGLPLRKEFLLSKSNRGAEDFGFSSDRKTILILGGSQGAVFINNLVLNIVEKIKDKYQIIHITGRYDYEKVFRFYKEKGVISLVRDFSYEIPAFMSFTDIAIARAGAGTIVELSFSGIPSILIPYKYSSGHQFHNARWAENFGCMLLDEKDATPERLINMLFILETEIEKRKKLFQSVRIADTDGRLARYCIKYLGGK